MMSKLETHPTVVRFREQAAAQSLGNVPHEIDADWLRQIVLEAGAADVGFVEIDRPALADQRAEIDAVLPSTKSLLSYVCRMNRDPVRSPARSVANLAFHFGFDKLSRRWLRSIDYINLLLASSVFCAFKEGS